MENRRSSSPPPPRLEKLAVRRNDSLMHTKALSVMGPEGGSKAAPVVVTHPTAGDRRSIARVQIPPLPLVSCVLSASFEYL